ncbi:NIPSNAP family containing protein [Muricauda sp. JGD-17]|uniref:NIPSNAP family containing protein n=1 Tax=Flagellimonas ochracea TaxID=2696472 RepID=A0A964T9N9_9FLAO|nr:NIPSNAP family protein [Allomuricauda ochracea]NAY90808.1 NIPSNAP family containing protein [Allomuricauda ochracea]
MLLFKKIALLIFFLCFFAQGQQELYELRTYELAFGKDANILHDYLENAFIPAMERQGLENIGAFKEWKAMPDKIYVLIPYESMEEFENIKHGISSDSEYLDAAEPYLNAEVDEFPINHYKSSFFKAFAGMPKIVKPGENVKLFELRTYLGYNEDALRRKVKMFNDHEFEIFEEVGFKPLFFGEKLIGDDMPSLTYFLAFESFEKHQESWAKFLQHPEWIRILHLDEYANTVSHIETEYLERLPYSKL